MNFMQGKSFLSEGTKKKKMSDDIFSSVVGHRCCENAEVLKPNFKKFEKEFQREEKFE